MTTTIQANVRRWNHNRELVSVKMIEAEPHVMKFIGDGGRELYGEEAQEMLTDLMEKGYEFQVRTVFVEATMMEFAG